MTSYFNRLLASTAFAVAVTGMTGCSPTTNEGVAPTPQPDAATAFKHVNEAPRTLLACTKDNRAFRHIVTATGSIPATASDSAFLDGFEKKLDESYGKYTRDELKTSDAAFADVQASGLDYILQFNQSNNATVDLKNVEAVPVADSPDAACVSRTAQPADISFTANDATLWACTKDNHSVEVYLYATFQPKFVDGVQVNSTMHFFDGFEKAMRDVYSKFPKADFEEGKTVTEAMNYRAAVMTQYLGDYYKKEPFEDIEVVDMNMSDAPTAECMQRTTPRITLNP